MGTRASCGCGVADCGCGPAMLCCGRAHWCSLAAALSVARGVGSYRASIGRAVRRCFGGSAVSAGSGAKTGFFTQILGLRSQTVAKFACRSGLIREKVIGHSVGRSTAPAGRDALVCRGGERLFGVVRRAVVASRGTFALLHQPARQHRRGIFFQPGIEELRDLFAEIGGVAEPRKFVTLQRVSRRREKELPRRLGDVFQGALQGSGGEVTTVNTIVKSTHIRTYCGYLWKSSPATLRLAILRACSACDR